MFSWKDTTSTIFSVALKVFSGLFLDFKFHSMTGDTVVYSCTYLKPAPLSEVKSSRVEEDEDLRRSLAA